MTRLTSTGWVITAGDMQRSHHALAPPCGGANQTRDPFRKQLDRCEQTNPFDSPLWADLQIQFIQPEQRAGVQCQAFSSWQACAGP